MSSTASANKDRDAYVFNRDFLASARLHLQHKVWISSLGYLLHPAIPVDEVNVIAEIGCGNGILSLELAKQLPNSSKVEAYDLSLAQCPPRGWWPENVTFSELDIFEPMPEHLVGVYDVVFIRHFICVVQSGDPMPLLSALLKLLKPGGYLQWQEWHLQSDRLLVADSDNPTEDKAPKLKALVDSIRGPNSSLQEQISWVRDFHSRFGDAGARLVAQERHRTAPEVMMIKQEVSFLVVREWCDNQRARDPASREAAKLEKLGNEAEEECLRLQRGTLVDTEMVTWVVMKQ